MKLYLVCIMFFTVFSFGCKGPAGPNGPTGNANVSTWTFDIPSSSFRQTFQNDTRVYSYGTSTSNKNFDQISSNGGALLVYFRSDHVAWMQLPTTEPTFPLQINYLFDGADLGIELRTTNGDALQTLLAAYKQDLTYHVRVVMIPTAGTTQLAKLGANRSYTRVRSEERR